MIERYCFHFKQQSIQSLRQFSPSLIYPTSPLPVELYCAPSPWLWLLAIQLQFLCVPLHQLVVELSYCYGQLLLGYIQDSVVTLPLQYDPSMLQCAVELGPTVQINITHNHFK